MNCQEAKDAEDLALREKDRQVRTKEKLRALESQQKKIKIDYQSQTVKLSQFVDVDGYRSGYNNRRK
mgnify:CR=1 FL=1